METFKVKYTGPDAAEIRNGEIYEAHILLDSTQLLAVKDRSGDWYAYPKRCFEPVPGQTQ